MSLFWLLLNVSLLSKDFIYLFIERGGEVERQREKHQCVVVSHAPLTGDLACNPGMCPEWELIWHPLGSQAGTQSTESHQPGLLDVSLVVLPWCLGNNFGPELDLEIWTRRPLVPSIISCSCTPLGKPIALLSDSNVCFWVSLHVLPTFCNFTTECLSAFSLTRGIQGQMTVFWRLRNTFYERQWSLWSLL